MFVLSDNKQEDMIVINNSSYESPKKNETTAEKTKPSQFFQSHSHVNANSILNQMLSATNISQTEKQILSHPMIRQIIQKSANKTVQHKDIGKIPANTRLYKIPQEYEKSEYHFDSIPPKDPKFSSTSSKKVTEINKRLSVNKSLPQRLQQHSRKSQRKSSNLENRAVSAGDKRVSISGLISYNFNSVKARRSLGNIPDCPEDTTLLNKIKQIKHKNSCSGDRQQNIIGRRGNRTSIQKAEIAKASVCDFHMPTDKFLKLLVQEKQKDDHIYGQTMEKLTCIKEYMQKQKVQYDEAEFIINQIAAAHKKEKKVRPVREPVILDDDIELEKRKNVVKKKRVMLKHFYFTE